MNYQSIVNQILLHLDREVEQKKKRIEHLQKQYKIGNQIEAEIARNTLDSVLGEWEQANQTRSVILDLLHRHESVQQSKSRKALNS